MTKTERRYTMKFKPISDKRGRGNTGLYLFGAIVVILLIAAVFGIYTQTMFQQQANNKKQLTPTQGCPDSTATVSFGAVNALEQGTAVTTTQLVRVNGGSASNSTTSYAVGANLEILWSAGNYLDKVTTATVPCGGGPITTDIYATDDMEFRIFNSNGDVLTDNLAGGAVNQTALGTGGSKNLKIYIDGKDKESSGDLIVVAEHTNTTGCDKIAFSGLGGVTSADIPGFYTVQAAGAKAFAFKVPAVVGANTVEGTLSLKAKSGQICSGPIYITAYSSQAFEDTDGKFIQSGVSDSSDAVKYEDDWDFDFFVNA